MNPLNQPFLTVNHMCASFPLSCPTCLSVPVSALPCLAFSSQTAFLNNIGISTTPLPKRQSKLIIAPTELLFSTLPNTTTNYLLPTPKLPKYHHI